MRASPRAGTIALPMADRECVFDHGRVTIRMGERPLLMTLIPAQAHRASRTVRLHLLVSLAYDVLAQALGTVLAGGLLYLSAVALGMIGGASGGSVVEVGAFSAAAIATSVTLIHRVADWRRSRGIGGCSCATCDSRDAG